MDPDSPSRAAKAPERQKEQPKQRRERELRNLKERLAAIQQDLVAVREGTRQLAEIELRRRLTPQETDRARTLRWESERLHHELRLLRERFEGLAPARRRRRSAA